jgi:hypothetical protein
MRRPYLALSLLIAALACAAQDEGRFRVLLDLESTSALAAGECADSLSAAVSRSPLVGEVVRSSGDAPADEEAGRLGFDLALEARLLPSEAGVALRWRILSASSGDEVGGGSVDAPLPDARELLDSFWSDLVSSLEQVIGEVSRPGEVRLLVTGPPGALVRGLGAGPVELGPDGSAELRVAAPATYAWSASARGRDRAKGVTAVLGQEPSRLDIAMPAHLRWTVEAGLFNGAFPDCWAAYRLSDDRLFLRAGLRQYLAGLSLLDASPGFDPSFLAATPLIQPGFGGGALLGVPGSAVRGYAGAQATLRIAFPKGAGVFIDPVAPLCVEAFGGLEWKPLRRWGFFAEAYAGLYLFADTGLFAASAKRGRGASPLRIYGSGWVFSAPDLRFGARLYL